MKNTLPAIVFSGAIAIATPIASTQQAVAGAMDELLKLGVDFCREAGCGSKVKKITEEKLPEGCSKVYMDMPGNNTFVYSTLVCECREKEADLLVSLEEEQGE